MFCCLPADWKSISTRPRALRDLRVGEARHSGDAVAGDRRRGEPRGLRRRTGSWGGDPELGIIFR